MSDAFPEDYPRYKRVVMYDAEKGKNYCTTLTSRQFASPEELEKHIKQLRANNTARNKEIRKLKDRESAQQKIDAAAAVVVKPVEVPQLIVNELPPQLVHNSEVSLRFVDSKGPAQFTCLILGSSKRGKTTLMMHLYNKYWAYPVNDKSINTLYSGNSQLTVYKHDRKLLIADGFNSDHEKYIKMQKYINTKTKNRYQFANFFDDIIDQKHSKTINNLILSYRNSNISCILCLQYLFMLSKQNRSSVHTMMVFGANSSEQEEALISHILKPYLVQLGYRDYNSQVVVFREITKNYGFFYIDCLKNTISTHRLTI